MPRSVRDPNPTTSSARGRDAIDQPDRGRCPLDTAWLLPLAIVASVVVACTDDTGRTSVSTGFDYGADVTSGASQTAGIDTIGGDDTSGTSGGDISGTGDTGDDTSGDDTSGDASSTTDSGDPGEEVPCETDATCEAPSIVLGLLSGDTGSASLMATGHQAAWVVFTVTEDDQSALNGANMSVIARLSPPAGVDFDLQAFRSVAPMSDPCMSTIVQSSQNTVGIDQVAMYWGENVDPNGEDDSRQFAVRVEPVQAACFTNRTWTLTVSRM